MSKIPAPNSSSTEAAELPAQGAEAIPDEPETRVYAAADGDGPAAEPSPLAEGPAAEPSTPVVGGMVFLGTLVSENLTAVRLGKGRPPLKVAVLPVVVSSESKGVIGVAIVSDPSFVGPPLDAKLAEAGHAGPFTYSSPAALGRADRAIAAMTILNAADPEVDYVRALGSFGMSPSMFV